MKRKFWYSLIGLILCITVTLVAPVSSVVLEVTSLGTVSELNVENNTLTISEPKSYGCDFPSERPANCSWTKTEESSLSGTVPDDCVFSLISPGDQVVVTSYGGPEGEWITVAKVVVNASGELVVTDAVGDISSLPVPYTGGYEIIASTIPDCTSCSGTRCTASAATVEIRGESMMLREENIGPGETLSYNGENNGSRVDVTFVSGTASSSTCEGQPFMAGPQPVSVFIVNIVPPIGEEQEQVAMENNSSVVA